jgi:polyhydroxyalkanoate synthesis regulator phasin
MRKTIFAILTLVFAISGLSAQSPTPIDPKTGKPAQEVKAAPLTPAPAPQLTPAEKAKRLADKMVSEAKINEDQRAKVYDALVNYHTAKDEIKQHAGDSKSNETKNKLQELQNSLDAKLRSILTPEQYDVAKNLRTKKH